MAQIVVTGANRGIGLALCQALTARGDTVVGVCRHRSEALDASGARIIDGIDLGDATAADRLTGALADVRPDVLINNAGILRRQSFGSIDDRAAGEIVEQFRINALGPLLLTQALAPHMSSGGKVIFVTSRMGSMADNGSGGNYGYRMSKAALNMAAVSLAHDLADRGLSVALVHPGYVRTDMTGNSGQVAAEEAAAGIIARMDALSPAESGGFWHANGQRLPW